MFKDPREYLKKYENMLSLFRGLTASLEHEYTLLKERLDSVVRYCGISKLPNELLIIVMEYVVSEFRDIFTLTRVCSRFRSLAISSPKLWANCELKMPSPAREVSLIADMSRGLPLSATLMSSFTHESDLLATERIFYYRHLLETLDITLVDTDVEREQMKQIQLPVLRNLTLTHTGCCPDEPASQFYETWEMPELRCLDTNFVPPKTLGKTITSFTLDTEYSDDCLSDFNLLLEFLASCPSLENLEVIFRRLRDDVYPESGDTIVMRNLKSLRLQVTSAKYFSWLARFLERLVIDNVTDLGLRLKKLRRSSHNLDVLARRITQYQESETWGPVILSRIAKISHLREMKLLIEDDRIGKEGEKGPSEYLSILSPISVVRELAHTLERFMSINPLCHIHMYRKNMHIPGGWTILEIDHAKALTLEQLLVLMSWTITSSGILFLRDCPSITEDELRSAIPDCIKVG
ncbi:hypothetical protein ACEPAI_5599 [Sanghuangporus weigelae]